MNPFHELSDEALMKKYQDGEPMAFDVLYERHQSRVYSYINHRLHDQDALDEVFQNIFMKLHKSRHLYDEKYLFVKWLYTIARTTLLDFYKKKKMDSTEFDETFHTTQEDEVETIELGDVKSLTEREKQVLELRYYSDKDFKEIAQQLNIGEANSRKIVSRSLKKLKTYFNGGSHE